LSSQIVEWDSQSAPSYSKLLEEVIYFFIFNWRFLLNKADIIGYKTIHIFLLLEENHFFLNCGDFKYCTWELCVNFIRL